MITFILQHLIMVRIDIKNLDNLKDQLTNVA